MLTDPLMPALKFFSITRNFNTKCAKITDKSIL